LNDPLYRELFATGRLPTEGLAIDLGCGRGEALALWSRAMALGMMAGGKRGVKTRLLGVESNPGVAESARLALGYDADIITGDIRSETLPSCRLVILQDVLLFLEPQEQDSLLQRIASHLEVGGLLILREPDASAVGYRTLGQFPGNALAYFYGDRNKQIYPKAGEEWKMQLQSLGFTLESSPGIKGGWFAKSLLFARKSLVENNQCDKP
ncbi:MAG: hypothetical protein ACOYMG_15825, partial [Candidatus Methylumidiphilus sp.]